MGYNYAVMRAPAIGILLAIFVAGYQGKVQQTQPNNDQNARQYSPAKAVAPVSNFAPAEHKQSTYQKAKDYLGKAFGPESIPNWALVVAAGIGLFATFRTLRIIRKQTDAIVRDADATQEAARATQASVELQKVGMEQWVDTEKWETDYLFTQDGTEILPIYFRIKNPTKFKIILHKAILWINGRHISSVWFRKQLLAPDGYTGAAIKYPLNAGQVAAYRRETLKFEVGGVIYFVDAFGKCQEQPFGYTCGCRSPDKSVFEPISFVPPSDAGNKEERKET